MTNLEIMARAIAYALEEDPETIANRLDRGTHELPPAVQTRLHTHRPDHEAAALLKALQKEKQGILRWIVEGSAKYWYEIKTGSRAKN